MPTRCSMNCGGLASLENDAVVVVVYIFLFLLLVGRQERYSGPPMIVTGFGSGGILAIHNDRRGEVRSEGRGGRGGGGGRGENGDRVRGGGGGDQFAELFLEAESTDSTTVGGGVVERVIWALGIGITTHVFLNWHYYYYFPGDFNVEIES